MTTNEFKSLKLDILPPGVVLFSSISNHLYILRKAKGMADDLHMWNYSFVFISYTYTKS